MKKLVLSLLFLGLTVQTFAQDVLFDAKIKSEEIPTMVVQSLKEDFPGYYVETFSTVPIEIIDDDIIINKDISSPNDYNTYSLKITGKSRELNATYDVDGNLISTYEYFKNVNPPTSVKKSLVKSFPGWMIEKDNYKLSSYKNHISSDRFKFILKKGDQTKRVYTNSQGTILKIS